MPALNTNEVFIDDLADAVVEALPYVGSLQRSASSSLSSLASSDALVPLGARRRAVRGAGWHVRVAVVWGRCCCTGAMQGH